MRQAGKGVWLFLGGFALLGFGVSARGATVSLKAVAINGVPLTEPSNFVIAEATDKVTAEVFLSGWDADSYCSTDSSNPLAPCDVRFDCPGGSCLDFRVRISQSVILITAGSVSGISGTILPCGRPDNAADCAFIGAKECDNGANEGDICEINNECPDGSCVDSADFILRGFVQRICAVNTLLSDYLYGCLPLEDEGTTDDGGDFYLGTVILEVSPDACGRFTFAMTDDPAESFMKSPTPTKFIFPVGESLVIEVECDPCISSDPPNCAIDARYPHEPDDFAAKLGWDSLDITFSPVPDGGVGSLGCGNFSIDVSSGTLVPSCSNVTQIDTDTVHMQLDLVTPVRRWTCITYNDGQFGCNKTCLGPLPADVTADRVSTGPDLLELIDSFNGSVGPLEIWQCDIDHDGQCLLTDIVAEIDLLLGVGDFDPWMNVPLPARCPSAP